MLRFARRTLATTPRQGRQRTSNKRRGPRSGTRRHGERPVDTLYGLHSVEAALEYRSRDQYVALHVLEGRESSAAESHRQRLSLLAHSMGIPVKAATRSRLNAATDGSHNGVMLHCSPIQLPSLSVSSDWEQVAGSPGERPSLLLLLDEIQDPQNLGSLLRSACFLGVDAVMMSSKNSSPLTATVSRSSAGALELLAGQRRLHEIRAPVPEVCTSLVNAGWDVVGTAIGDANCKDMKEIRPSSRTVVAVGNEGRGLRPSVKDACSQLAFISGGGTNTSRGHIDSLNVGVAAGVILSHFSR